MSDAEFLERIASYMGRDDYRDRLRAIASRLTAPEPSVTALWCSLDIVAHEMDRGIYRDDAPELIRKAAQWIKDAMLAPPEPSVEEVPTPDELNRYRNDVIFHDLVMRFRSYVDGGLGKYEDIIAAAQFGRKIHWNESAQLAAKLKEPPHDAT